MIRAKHLICKSRSGLLYHQRQCKTVIVFQNLVEDSLWGTDFDDIRHAVVRTESTQTCRPYVRQIIWPSASVPGISEQERDSLTFHPLLPVKLKLDERLARTGCNGYTLVQNYC